MSKDLRPKNSPEPTVGGTVSSEVAVYELPDLTPFLSVLDFVLVSCFKAGT